MTYQLLSSVELKDNYIRKTALFKVVDGDTLQLYVHQGFTQGFEETVRLNRVDCPESRGTESVAGQWVREQVVRWITDNNLPFVPGTIIYLHSVNYSQDRYGRVLADIYKPNGENLNQWLLSNAYAWPTDETGKIIGPRDIRRLNLPSGIIEQVLLNQRT
jgi:endonuclease YncB( thermonuclease family)